MVAISYLDLDLLIESTHMGYYGIELAQRLFDGKIPFEVVTHG